MIDNFVKYVMERGGTLSPLSLPSKDTNCNAQANPSIFYDNETSKLYFTIRCVNYILIDNQDGTFGTPWGPCTYIHPENDRNLRTVNFIGELKKNETNGKYDIVKFGKVNYKLDTDPKWNFIGEEDVRIVKWDGKFYLTGCRRDVKADGESRMELSEIDIDSYDELNRIRIPSNDNSQIEKNWMPILDQDFTYIKWSFPTLKVHYNKESNTTDVQEYTNSNVTINTESPMIQPLRGSSQIIPYKDFYIGTVHETELWPSKYKTHPDAHYYNRICCWDKNFNLISISERYNFFHTDIDFSCGLTYKDGVFLIPFANMDSASYLLEIPENVFIDFMHIQHNDGTIVYPKDILEAFALNSENPRCNYDLAEWYYNNKQYCSAGSLYYQSCRLALKDTQKDISLAYSAMYMFTRCICHNINPMYYRSSEMYRACLNNLIMIDSDRAEGYYELAIEYFYGYKEKYNDETEYWTNNIREADYYKAVGFIKLAYKCNSNDTTIIGHPEFSLKRNMLLYTYYNICGRCGFDNIYKEGMHNLYLILNQNDATDNYIIQQIREKHQEIC